MKKRPILVAALLFATLMVAPGPPAVSAQTSEFTENFDDQDVLDPPTNDRYTLETVGSMTAAHVSADTNTSAPHSFEFRTAAISSGARFDFGFAAGQSGNLCDAEKIDFSVNMTDPASNNDLPIFGIGNRPDLRTDVSANSGIFLRMVSTGAGRLTGVVLGSGTTSFDTADFLSDVGSQWVRVSIRDISCTDPASARFILPDHGVSTILTAPSGPVSGQYLIAGVGVSTSAVAMNGPAYIDDIEISGLPPPPPPQLAPRNEVAGISLRGFDIDKHGTSAVVRFNNTQNVTTYSARSLAPNGVSINTNCGTVDRVAITPEAVSFVQCLDTPGGAECPEGSPCTRASQISIRSHAMGTPPIPTGCTHCLQDIEMDDISGDTGGVQEIGDVEAWPFDYSTQTTGVTTLGIDQEPVYMAWAYSILSSANLANRGSVGVMTYTMNKAGDGTSGDAGDRTDHAEAVLDASASAEVDEICITRASDGKDYLIGATENGNSKVWRVDFSASRDNLQPTLDVSMTQTKTLGTSAGTASGVGCGRDRALFYNGVRNEVAAVNILTGSVLWKADVTSARVGRAAAVDPSGEFAAWVDGTSVYLAHASNGTLLAELTDVTGGGVEIRKVAMDNNGQMLWVATDSGMQNWETWPVTTVEEVGTGDIEGPPTINPSGGETGSFGADTKTSLTDAGMSDAQAGLMLFGMLASALFVVFAGVAAMAFRSGAGAIMGGALGVVTSIVLSWSFDWLSNGQTVVIVLLASGLGALAIFVWR